MKKYFFAVAAALMPTAAADFATTAAAVVVAVVAAVVVAAVAVVAAVVAACQIPAIGSIFKDIRIPMVTFLVIGLLCLFSLAILGSIIKQVYTDYQNKKAKTNG